MNKFLLNLLLLLMVSTAFGQKESPTRRSSSSSTTLDFPCVDCVLEYDKGDPFDPKGVIPDITPVKIPAGGSVLLMNRFMDVDRVRFASGDCDGIPTTPSDWFPVECPGYLTRFDITENSAFGSFSASTDLDQIEVGYFSIGLIPVPGVPVPFNLWQSESVMLHTTPDWPVGSSLKVTVDLVDNAPLPPNDMPGFVRTGSCQDDELTDFHTWEFIHDEEVPEALEQNASNPAEGEWTDMFDVGSSSYIVVVYKYKGLDDCPQVNATSFESHAVIEDFTSESVQFEFSDLKTTWLNAHGVTTLQQAIDLLFPLGLHGAPNTFILDANSEFSDAHSLGYDNAGHNPGAVFTDQALLGNKVGYILGQQYRNTSNSSLGTTVIQRQIRQVPGEPPGVLDWLIKKDHMICN